MPPVSHDLPSVFALKDFFYQVCKTRTPRKALCFPWPNDWPMIMMMQNAYRNNQTMQMYKRILQKGLFIKPFERRIHAHLFTKLSQKVPREICNKQYTSVKIICAEIANSFSSTECFISYAKVRLFSLDCFRMTEIKGSLPMFGFAR